MNLVINIIETSFLSNCMYLYGTMVCTNIKMYHLFLCIEVYSFFTENILKIMIYRHL